MTKDRIIGRANFAAFSAIAEEGNFHAICEDWHAMRLDQFEHNHLVGSAIDSKDRVGTLVEFLYAINRRASESFAADDVDTEISP